MDRRYFMVHSPLLVTVMASELFLITDRNDQDRLKDQNADINDQLDDEIDDEAEEIEAYCVKCKHKVVMEDPEAVWTSKGMPGTRGTCPDCGTTVFRMGQTAAHREMVRPAA